METCRPDEYPPYEPVSRPRVRVTADLVILDDMTRMGRLLAWTALGVIVGYLWIVTVVR